MMIARIRRGLTFANVMSVIAVFIALGGTVYATNKISGKTIKKGSEPGNRLKNDTVTGKQVKEATLSGVDAATLQGQGPGAFAPANIESPHLVGAPGEPVFENSWAGVALGDEPLLFYKDPYGIVHLQGNTSHTGGPSATQVFTLPPGYRPAAQIYFPAFADGNVTTTVEVDPDGSLIVLDATFFLGLSSVSFRAGV